ncbi:hypothetical protein, partial [Bacteroides thetaiotaomicron]|uniref:hypothetical protein n=1 Tax=Bacteroides thetaiotaomicron TaxID=818 RepID=UPI001E5337CF
YSYPNLQRYINLCMRNLKEYLEIEQTLIGDGATTIEGNNNVHTLQNAYFTISQKELPITL